MCAGVFLLYKCHSHRLWLLALVHQCGAAVRDEVHVQAREQAVVLGGRGEGGGGEGRGEAKFSIARCKQGCEQNKVKPGCTGMANVRRHLARVFQPHLLGDAALGGAGAQGGRGCEELREVDARQLGAGLHELWRW